MRVLAGDVGGTNLRLALVEDSKRPRVLSREIVPVAEQEGLAEPLERFLTGLEGERPAAVCLGVAGTLAPDRRRAQGVNLGWELDADALSAACGLPVELINDFHAAARGVECLSEERLTCLSPGAKGVRGPRAVFGAGTGLGQALLLPEGEAGWRVVASEGGHRGFAPTSATQDRLLHHLRASLGGRVSTERVLSGPGLLATYRFLVVEGRSPCAAVQDEAPAARPAAVTRAALAGNSTCREALTIFVEVYGAEAANIALTLLARGGVYLAGGIAPQIFAADPEWAERFQAAYLNAGRFRGLLDTIPVWLIEDPDLGLLGAGREGALSARSKGC